VPALVDAGYRPYRTDGTTDAEAFAHDVEVFAESAFNRMPYEAVVDEPLQTDPRALTTVASAAAASVASHPKYAELTEGYADPDMALVDDIRRLWAHHVRAHLVDFESLDDAYERLRPIAEHVYRRRKEDEYGPPPGRVVTGVVDDVYEDVPAIEIPLAHANRHCEVRNEQGALVNRLRDGNIYVPYSDLRGKLVDATESAFDTHLSRQLEEFLSEEQRGWLVRNTEHVHHRIDEFLAGNEHDRLFDREDDFPALVRVFINAIRDSETFARFDEPYTADSLRELLEDYRPAHPANQHAVDGLTSPASVSRSLVEHESCSALTVDRSQRKNRFEFSNPFRSGVPVEVDEPTDILELPCMANIDEYLHEEKPVRWILYSVARILFSLDNGFTMDELVSFYSRYPWFDEATTRYQLRYERDRGEDILPIGCDNDNRNFATFCIGKENCEYSIYSSLPFSDDVYDRLDERSDTAI